MLTRLRVSPGSTSALVCLLLALSTTTHAATLLVDDDLMDCPAAAFVSIQPAIAAAGPGDTIKVCRGTYAGSLVLNKDLTLEGAQSGIDARGRVTPNESIITSVTGTLLTLITGSANSTIDGFTFVGGSRAIESTSGPINGLQILNNRIQGFTGNGVFLNDSGLDITVNQNEIDGTAKIGGGGLFHLDTDNFNGFWFTNNNVINGLAGTGFFVDGNRNVVKAPGTRIPQFTGNLINNNGTGVNLGSRAWGDGPISGNTFSNNRFDGLQGGPRDSRIEDNWFDLNGRDGLVFTSFGSMDPLRGGQRNTIELNCFTRNGFAAVPLPGAGLAFSAGQAPGTISTNAAHRNNIVGNLAGVRYLGAEVIRAEDNWWGSPTGPNHPTNPSGAGNPVVDNGTVVFTPWRTAAVAGTPCGAGPATTLTLEPATAMNPVDSIHCVTATVTNAFGIPQSGVDVQFTVTGSVNESGTVATSGDGEAEFCYQGPPLPGADAVAAIADADDDGMFEAGEPGDTATKAWMLPVTTPGCEITITHGGWIIAMNGDRASFGGNAKSDGDGNVSGQEEYQDHGPVEPFNLHGTPAVITCGPDDTQATIFGDATINGTGSHQFRIDVRDIGEPGKGVDHYRIQVDSYDSGDQTLEGGNVQIKRQD